MHPTPIHLRCRTTAVPTATVAAPILVAALLLACISVPRLSAQANNVAATESLALNTDSVAPRRFLAVHGRRSLIDGYADSGLEVWAYPVELIHSYRVGFRPAGTTSEISGASTLRRITYLPQSRGPHLYRAQLYRSRKKSLYRSTPRARLSPIWSKVGRRSISSFTSFPVLNLMWPAGIGGQDVTWNETSSGYVLTEQTHRFAAIVGSTDIVAHDEIFNRPNSSATQGSLAFTVRPGGSFTQRTATVVVASSDGDATRLATLVKALTTTASEMETRAIDHYSNLRASALQIETPNALFNRYLAWAEVALDQAWVCNPYLGCGLVAGYGPSRGARRPQYAWFFAGDAMLATRALLSAGEYSRARQTLEFIAKYQDPKTGMIWHEMSQSAGLIDWVGKYPYMFVHVDISFQYLNTVRRLCRRQRRQEISPARLAFRPGSLSLLPIAHRPSRRTASYPRRQGGRRRARPHER